MTDEQLLQAAGERLKKLLAKRKRGIAFNAEDRAFLDPSSVVRPPSSHDSIAHAAAGLGVTLALLKLAKKAGAPGFQGSRVYPEKLLPWLVKWLWDLSKLKEQENFKTLIEAEKARGAKWKNDLNDGLYIRRAEVDAWQIETIEKIKALLPAKLLNELPPKLEGLRAAEIAARLEPLIPELCALLRWAHQSETERVPGKPPTDQQPGMMRRTNVLDNVNKTAPA